MLSLSTPADESGIAIISAAARAAVASAGGNGEAAALVLQMVAADAQTRSSGGQDSSALEFTAAIDGTEVLLTLRDRGEPLTGPAQQILPLIELGVMTSAEAAPDGTGNVTELRFARPGHSTLPDTAGVERVAEDAPLSSEEVTIRSLEPGDAASLTRAIYRSYGWTYPHPELYYPERTAAAIESGKRIGEVAVTADGEVVAHWGGVFVTPTIVNSGLALTDPRFRRRGIAKQLMERFWLRIEEAGVTGRVGEPVLTHTATQELTLQGGGNIVGAFLSYGVPVAQVGITDGMLAGRRSLAEAYFDVGGLTPATLWIPTPYLSFVRGLLEQATWPRDLGDAHRIQDVPEHTLTSTKHDSLNRRGEIDVHVIGRDLIDVVDSAMDDLRRAGSEVVHVRLPATDPSLAVLGEGLTELGLAYSALIPGYLDGHDALILQWLADADVDTSSWHYANDQVESFITSILEQVRELSDRGAQSRRRAARRASLFAALDR
jgi:GNAT superfamily N-acetyltransferase